MPTSPLTGHRFSSLIMPPLLANYLILTVLLGGLTFLLTHLIKLYTLYDNGSPLPSRAIFILLKYHCILQSLTPSTKQHILNIFQALRLLSKHGWIQRNNMFHWRARSSCCEVMASHEEELCRAGSQVFPQVFISLIIFPLHL